MHITILSGSTRINRLSHRVAVGLAKVINAQGNHTAEVLDLAEYRFPLMEEVLQSLLQPPVGLAEFACKIKDSDAHIMVSPEYNGSYTAALKNAVDYLIEGEFQRKAVGVVSVTSGMMGGMRAAMAMQQLVLGIGGYALPQMLTVGQVAQRFDENGDLLDPVFEKNVFTFLQNFYWLGEAVAEKKMAFSGTL